MARRRVIVVLVLLAVGGVVVLQRVWRRPPTDEEQILALFHDAARAAEERRIGDVVRGVSAGFQADGMDKRALKQVVALHVLRGTWVSVTVASAKVEVRGDSGRAVVDVVLSRSGKGTPLAQLLPEQASLHRFALKLAREEDGWRATTATWRPITLDEAVAGPELPSAP